MENGGQGQGRARSPPPPPTSSDDAQLPSHEPKEEGAAAADAVDQPEQEAAALPSLEDQEPEQGAAVHPSLEDQEAEQAAAAALLSLEDRVDVAKEHEEEREEVAEEEGGSAAAAGESVEGPAVLTDDLRDKIVRQVEYYFSDENLPTDKFMLKFVKKDKQGFVPIVVVASFKKMKRLVKEITLIEAALRTSSRLVVSKDGRKVRRLHPLPIAETKDAKSCTVIVENLPDDYSTDNLQKIFAAAGKIINITLHHPHSTEELKPTWKTEMAFSSKLHALIEYETTDAAANAVATLNDEKDWRNGMRVELLLKRMGKYGLYHKGHKEMFSEKNNSNHTSEASSDEKKLKSDEHHDDKAEKEEEEHLTVGKGRHKNRYRGRGRGQQNSSGPGHGQAPSSSSNGMSKPPPGPRMPDGTRGFTMGRGKPSIFEPIQHSV